MQTSTPTRVLTHSHLRCSGPTCAAKCMAVGALDGCPGEHRVTEQSPATRSDAGKRLAVVDDAREAHVVTGPPGDQRDVTAAGLVEGDRVRVRFTDPCDCLLHHPRIAHLGVAAGQTGEAQVHLHQCVRRARPRCRRGRPRGSAAGRRHEGERAPQRRKQHGRRTPRTGGARDGPDVHVPSTVCRGRDGGDGSTCVDMGLQSVEKVRRYTRRDGARRMAPPPG